MAREYSQKAALVTGGAQGIGGATAAMLAERGYRVAVADIKSGGDSAMMFIRCDISRESAVRACVRQVVKRFGRLDALVNNAGIASPETGPVEKLTLAQWNRRIGVNLTGAFLMAKHAAPHLLQSEPDTEAYVASKGGLVALTHALAMSLGPHVRVNCVSPGWINTKNAKLSRADHAQHPVGRVGRPSPPARATSWMAA